MTYFYGEADLKTAEEGGNVNLITRKFLSPSTGVNILSRDPLGPGFQQEKIELKSVVMFNGPARARFCPPAR